MADKDSKSAKSEKAELEHLRQLAENRRKRRRRQRQRRRERQKASRESHPGSKEAPNQQAHGKKRPSGFERFLRLFEDLEKSGESATGDCLVSVLGVVPAFASSEAMMAQAQAQSTMMANQVANQQRINTIQMAATAACVSELMQVSRRTDAAADRVIIQGLEDLGPEQQ